MFKRFLSVILTLIIVFGAAVICVSAADVQKTSAAADSDVCATGNGTIYFDAASAGWQNAGSIRFYVYLIHGNELAPRNSDTLCGVKGDDNIWSYRLSMSTHFQYGLILINGTTGEETYPLVMDASCVGDTAYATDKKLENPENHRKQSKVTRWRSGRLGPELRITSIGNVVGEIASTNTTKYKDFVNYLAASGNGGLKNALTLTNKSVQTSIDGTAKALDLTQSRVKQAISDAKVSGHSITKEKADWSGQWSASKSTLPAGALNQIPVLKVSLETDGVRLSWTAIEDVNRYRIYYKYGSEWREMANFLNETTYLDTDVRPGYRYSYTIRGMTSDWSDYVTSYNNTGVTITYIPAPTISLSKDTDGVKVSWKNVYSPKYRVYRKVNGSWKKVGDTASTSFTDTTAPSGTTQTYTVRGINAAGTAFTSSYRAGKSIHYVAAPKFILSNTTSGVKVSWSALGGAEKYRVYRKNGSSWVKLSDTESTAYTDTTAKSGTTYTYTVRCINAAGSSFTSTYRAGKSIKYVAAPVIALSKTSTGVKVSWKAVSGAEKYRVYRKNGSSWVKLADTTSTSYVDKNVKSGTTYTYTVRCINAKGTAFTSAYYAGKSIKYTR